MGQIFFLLLPLSHDLMSGCHAAIAQHYIKVITVFAMRLFSVLHGHHASVVDMAHELSLEHGNRREEAVLIGVTMALYFHLGQMSF